MIYSYPIVHRYGADTISGRAGFGCEGHHHRRGAVGDPTTLIVLIL